SMTQRVLLQLLRPVIGTKQHCGCRSSAWPEVEVLQTRIEGSQEPAGEAAFDPGCYHTTKTLTGHAISRRALEKIGARGKLSVLSVPRGEGKNPWWRVVT